MGFFQPEGDLIAGFWPEGGGGQLQDFRRSSNLCILDENKIRRFSRTRYYSFPSQSFRLSLVLFLSS